MEINVFGNLTFWIANNFQIRQENRKYVATAEKINSNPFILQQLKNSGYIGRAVMIYYQELDEVGPGFWRDGKVYEDSSLIYMQRSPATRYLYVGDPKLLN